MIRELNLKFKLAIQ
jgi:Ca2+-binding EF-hand superfamily protein